MDWSSMDENIIPLTFLPAFERLFMNSQKFLVKFLNAQIDSHISLEKSEIHSGYEEVKKPLIHYETNKFNFYITLNDKYIDCDDYEKSSIFLNPYVSVTFALYENIDKTIGEEKIYQIVINCNPLDSDKGEFEVKFSDKRGITLNFYTAFVKNIEYYKNKYYVEKVKLDESKLWLLALNACTYKQLYEIICQILNVSDTNEFMEKIYMINHDKYILEKWGKRDKGI
ncbi:MAG: hypothetical protein IKF01_04225 [Bacilli bacterium]|nr:hypothetical protein [Bacilli bacterium]